MKTYRVLLYEETHGEVIVEAENEDAAEEKALYSKSIEWDDGSETHVCHVEELPSHE